jgi:diaminohydroxyphosphoribosylaminopyrimidine deaminase/5-amino-6-(5-phosphoribosylamino)uracil reductase
VRRVVCAIEDPDPRVCGKGLAFLKDAGVRIEVGVCAAKARWMAAGHILRMTRGRPFVQLKLAVSADGMIAPGYGRPTWVTGPEARAFAHLLRARADAILVGRQTIVDDDPELTCRLPSLELRSPRRIILDTRFHTPTTSKVVQTAADVPLLIIGGTEPMSARFPPQVSKLRVATDCSGKIDLHAALGALRQEGVTRLLVEGGPHVARSFLMSDLVDEAVIVEGTSTLGQAALKPFMDRGLEVFSDPARWRLADKRRIGQDLMMLYRALNRFGLEE